MAVPGTDADSNLKTPGSDSGTGDRWRKVEALFNAASDMEREDRPAFLAAVCGEDQDLRLEVESLLDSADRTLGLLHQPVQEAARSMAAGAALTNRRIGNYELIRLLGEGGMGEVYLAARADDQFRQHVAIKLMRVGLQQNQSMLPRFLEERQILANLNHPNIARLLDGGLTSEGWPYLVMELVEGIPIDQYCRRHALDTASRLRLFGMVCSAVEHTHRSLIIHQDIKPANILVNGSGFPKLLDFGIAKLLDPDAANADPARPAQRLMTPDYASPEQIQGHAITTATDVFGLGVLLYELLAGRNPFRTRRDTPTDISREICEGEPKPLGEFAKGNPGLAAPDARKWTPELDSIVHKALRKEPANRYQSVEQLSADVAAYLEDRPVSTHAGSWAYLAAKFIRRNTALAALAAAALIALVGFSIALGVMARRATTERLKAERESRFLVDMFKAATPQVARGQTVTARNLLDEGAKRIDSELAAVPAARASLMHSMAEAYESLGLFEEAKALAERAYRLKASILGTRDPSTGDSLFLFANIIRLQGQYAKAEPLFRDLAAMRKRQAGDASPAYATALNALGECLYLEAKDTEAEPLLLTALAVNRRNGPDFGADGRNYLALLLERKGEYQEAAALLREAVAIQARTQGVNSPDYTTSLHNLASALIDQGDLSGAEAKLRETLEIRRRVLGNTHPDLAYTLNNLGYVLLEKGDARGAEPFLREALELNTQRLGEKHPSVAGNLNNWARLLAAEGDPTGAREYFHKALDTLRQANAFTSWPASQILLNLGVLEFDTKNYAGAETLARESLEMRRTLGGEDTPGVAAALIELAEDQLFQGYPRTAEPLLRRALEIRREKYAPKHPAIVAAQVRLGEALIANGEAANAEPVLRDALAASRTAPFPLLPWQVAETESALAACLSSLGRPQEADPLERESGPGLAAHPRSAFRTPAAVRLAALQAKARK
jgi:tetratricopeptide (TPR) repeat protein